MNHIKGPSIFLNGELPSINPNRSVGVSMSSVFDDMKLLLKKN